MVLPVPVWATPVMSSPSNACGIDCSCIGVSSVKPMSSIAFFYILFKFNSSNFIIYFLFAKICIVSP